MSLDFAVDRRHHDRRIPFDPIPQPDVFEPETQFEQDRLWSEWMFANFDREDWQPTQPGELTA